MKIPTVLDEKESFYEETLRKCLGSQSERAEAYVLLRHYFLFGRGPDEDECPYNKIYPHIDTTTAFLFASETTKFSVHVGAGEPEIEMKRVKSLNQAVNDKWLDSNTDQVFSQALIWSLVFNTMLLKVIHRVHDVGVDEKRLEITPFSVDPSMFGVLREDVPYLGRQEAFSHSFYTTKSQLERDLIASEHKKTAEIIASVSASPVAAHTPDGLDRILLTASTPTMQGNVNSDLNLNIDYQPRVDEDLVLMHELWLWDDDIKDYRVVTRTDTGMTVFDRKNIFMHDENPFRQVCPNPMYSYFWGVSEVGRLTALQKWRNERVQQIRKLLNLQVKPPTAMTGWMGIVDEKDYALFSEGGTLSNDSMQAKVERYAPDMPQHIFDDIHEIDAMFAEASGLQNILMGKGETGVRSGRQTSELARLSSARIKKRALIIEDTLEDLATLYLKLMKKYDTTEYTDDEGRKFTAAQFTDNFVVKVDAHSNSPLFIEDLHALAQQMLEVKAISRERYIEIIDPPDKELILRELKTIEAQEAKSSEMQMKLEEEKIAAKHGGQQPQQPEPQQKPGMMQRMFGK